MTNRISPDKTYRTRCGYETRLVVFDNPGDYQILGLYKPKDEAWRFGSWTLTGRYRNDYDSDLNLVKVRPRIKRSFWVNIYPVNYAYDSYTYPTKPQADNMAAEGRLACVRVEIDCEEGEGLWEES